jgi:uroporphyrinogen decarboxylase
MYEHREADRVPVTDIPWAATIARWEREGLPKGTNFADYFGLDQIVRIAADNSPRYPVGVVEETDECRIVTNKWGATYKEWKNAESTPEFLNFTIVDRDSWAKAKARIKPDRDRVDWETLKREYPVWRERGHWINGLFYFGFDVTHAWIVGTERLLMAMVEDPEWCMDIFNHTLDVEIALFEMIWDAGYTFDGAFWWDDMGYKRNQFFSLRTYREVLKPVHARLIEWAHARGIKTHLHSCGDITPFVPELTDMGLDCLHPLEVKAGMDSLRVKKEFGDRLVLHGGINAMLWNQPDAMEAEIRQKLPALKQDGGYIFSSDHSVPSSTSLEDFRRTIEVAKEVGRY